MVVLHDFGEVSDSMWWGPLLCGVAVSERAGPFVIAVWLSLQSPRGMVFEHVVVTAEWFEIVVVGGAALDPGVTMVDVTVVDRHSASGMDAGRVAGRNASFGGRAGPVSGGSIGDNGPIVGNRVVPGGFCLGGGGLAGDVGDDRAVSGQLTGSVGEFAEGRQIDMEMYTTTGGLSPAGVVAF